MNGSSMNDFLRNYLENLSGKKTVKSTTQFFENLVKSHGFELEFNILTVLFESIDWKDATENANPKDAFKIDFLKKKLKQLKFEPNFVDYFGPSVTECANRLVIYERFRDILKVLKIGHPYNLIFSTSFALNILDDRQELLGTQLLKEHLVEASEQEKPQSLPTDFVLTLGEFLKANDKIFRDVAEPVKSFFVNYLACLKDPRLKTLFSVGVPEMNVSDLNKDGPSVDFAKMFKTTPKLAGLLRELVWNRAAFSDILRLVLKDFPTIPEVEVFECLVMMCSDNARESDAQAKSQATARNRALCEFALESLQFNPDEPAVAQAAIRQAKDDPKLNHNEWKIDQFLLVLTERYGAKMSWENIIKSAVGFNSFGTTEVLSNARFYELFFGAIDLIKKITNARLPVDFLTTRWANSEFQFNFMFCLLQIRDTRPGLLSELSGGPQDSSPEQLNPSFAGHLQQVDPLLLNSDFVSLLFELGRLTKSLTALRAYFETALSKNFEGTFVMLVWMSNRMDHRPIRELLRAAVLSILNSSTNFPELVEAFFKANRLLFVSILAEVCTGDSAPIYLSKLIDFSQNIKDFVPALTHTEYHYFSISLSLLAVRREYMRLENWVEERIQNGGIAWMNEFLFYVQRNLLDIVGGAGTKKTIDEALEKSQLSKNSIAIIFEAYLLGEKSPAAGNRSLQDKVRQFFATVQRSLPDLAQVNPPDTEKFANDILTNYYEGRITIEDLVTTVQKLKSSNSNREDEIIACMIINIIDEYRFYQNFPEKELFLTSEIYGRFISDRLIDGRSQLVFLKAISDSLEKEGKMFQFAVKALNYFIYNIDLNLPIEFYKLLFANEKLRRGHFGMLFDLRKKLAEVDKEKLIDAENLRDVNRRMDAYNKQKEQAEEEENARLEARLAAERSKAFEKSLIEVLSKKFEELEQQDPLPQHHKDKLTFWLNGLDDKKIEKHKLEFMEIIKEIGSISWFCKNLVYKRVPAEPVIQNVYRKLIYRTPYEHLHKTVYKHSMNMFNQVIDFVCSKPSLMEQDKNTARCCGKWVGLITLLCNKPILLIDLDIKKRLYESLENKTVSNLVPIVCAFIKNIEKSQLFKSNVPFINSIMSFLSEILQIPWISHTTKISIEIIFNEFQMKDKNIYKFEYVQKRRGLENGKELGMNVKSLASAIKIDNALIQEHNLKERLHVELKHLVLTAMNSAVQDVIKPVLDRSVKIALETTKELVFKDFAMEPDERKVIECAKNMIQSISWNLALVACYDPIRIRLTEHLTKLLRIMSDLDETARKAVREAVINSNLDLGYQIVKSRVVENSLEELMKDETVQRELLARKHAASVGQTYVSSYAIRLRGELPDWCTAPEAITDLDKVEIYSARFAPVVAGEAQVTQPFYINQLLNDSGEQPKVGDESRVVELVRLVEAEINSSNTDEKLKKMQSLFASLVKALENLKGPEAVLPNLTEILLQKLFSEKPQLETLRYYADILSLYRNHFPKLPVFVTNLALKAEEPGAFTAELSKYFLKNYLMDPSEFDEQLSKLMSGNSANVLKCALLVLRNVLVEDKIFSVYAFPKIVEQIFRLSNTEVANMTNLENSIFMKNLVQFVTSENAINALKLSLSTLEPAYNRLFMDMKDYFSTLNEPLFALATEAVSLFSGYINRDELVALFMRHQEAVKEERALNTYFSYMLELVVNQTCPARGPNAFPDSMAPDYNQIDNLSAYVIAVLETSPQPEFTFEKVFTSFIMVLTKKHICEGNARVSQRPFFRVLFNLIQAIHAPEFTRKSCLSNFNVVILQTMHIIQPLKYPSFAFAWMQLIFNPVFMKAVLRDTNKEVSGRYTILLVDLMMFVRDVFTLDPAHEKEMREFFKGILRLLLVLIVNHSDYVCDNSFVILEEISPRFVQFRNLILSAYPRGMKSPDPFDIANQNYQNSPEYKALPTINAKIEFRVSSQGIQTYILNFMKSKDQKEIDRIIEALYITDYKGERQINTPLLESFVVYVPYLIHTSRLTRIPKLDQSVRVCHAEGLVLLDLFRKLISAS